MLRPFQIEGVKKISDFFGRCILADEQGCIDGETIINVNRAKKGFKIKLKDAYWKEKHTWDKSIPTFARALKDGVFGLHQVKKFLYKGVKPVLKITTNSGKTIKLTKDHEILTPLGWVEASQLQIQDTVFVNGITVCKDCGRSSDVIAYKHAKFKGYCKKCMYSKFRRHKNDVYEKKSLGGDGYIYLRGQKYHDHPRYTAGGVLEHVYLMEKWIGRTLTNDEEIHHINRVRSDNRKSNLQLLTRSEHKKIHKNGLHFHGGKTKSGNDIILLPKQEQITSIEHAGETDVYDIVMEEPYHNFVANGIVVHNCGKTVQALSWVKSQREAFPVLVICRSSGKLKWEREVYEWIGNHIHCKVLFGTLQYKDLSRYDLLIVNWDILHHHIDVLMRYNPKTIIADEMQAAKEWTSKRTAALCRLGINATYIIALSGTPIINRPLELYNILWLLRPDIFWDKQHYKERYCGPKSEGFVKTYNGLSNARELFHLLHDNVMIRRLKKDILPELPPVQYNIIPLPADKDEHDRIMNDFRKWCKTAGARKQGAMSMVQLGKAKQAAAFAKLPAAIAWIDDFLLCGEKLVVFAWHVEIIARLAKHFRNESVQIRGDAIQKDRAVQRFQADPACRIALANMLAAGDTINLTAASNAVFLELPWTPPEFHQCVGRIYGRMNDLHGAMVYVLVSYDTIEDKLANILIRKEDIISKAIDGHAGDTNSVFEQILRIYE